VLVAIVIAWPSLVTSMLPSGPNVDPSKIEIKLEADPNQTPEPPAATTDPAQPGGETKDKAQQDADDLQRQLGGTVEKSSDAPAAPPAGQTADEKAAADIERMLKENK
jgi:hypothetical protein